MNGWMSRRRRVAPCRFFLPPAGECPSLHIHSQLVTVPFPLSLNSSSLFLLLPLLLILDWRCLREWFSLSPFIVFAPFPDVLLLAHLWHHSFICFIPVPFAPSKVPPKMHYGVDEDDGAHHPVVSLLSLPSSSSPPSSAQFLPNSFTQFGHNFGPIHSSDTLSSVPDGDYPNSGFARSYDHNPFGQPNHTDAPQTSEESSNIGTSAICRGCDMEIRERHLLCVHRPRHSPDILVGCPSADENKFWHESCLRCSQCERQLGNGERCFVKDGRIYCREDHQRAFGSSSQLGSPSCSHCALPISASDFVFRSGPSHIYHIHCFKCSFCGSALSKGDKYVKFEGQLMCERELNLQQQKTPTHHNGGPNLADPPIPPAPQPQFDSTRFLHIPPFPDLDFSTLQRPNFHHQSDRSKKIPKRPRTILNAPQRKAFKIAFEKGPKPSRKVREQLARETGLSVRVVQVWFQNQRAKMKKEKKREMDKQQQSTTGGSVSTSTDSERKEDGDQTAQKSSQSESGKSERVAEDDESDYGCDEADEEDDEGNQSQTGRIFCAGNGSENQRNIQSNEQQNPIERMNNMYQTYFAFV